MHNLLEFLKYLATSNTINFIIMLIILGWIVKKVNVNKILDSGINKIENDIKKSDNEKEVAQKKLDKAQKIIDGLPNDLKTLDINCNDKIEVFKNQIQNNTTQTIENINNNIDKIIKIDEKKISNLITEDTAKDAIVQAKNDIVKMLEENPQLHDKFIENSIQELDKVQI